MRNHFSFFGFCLIMCVCSHFAGVNAKCVSVTSPDGAIKVSVGVASEKPYYQVTYGSKELVLPSHLGFVLNDGQLGERVEMKGSKTASTDETWTQLWGEDETVVNRYNELTVNFKERTGQKRMMTVIK